jgi:hypothetical protein
MAVLLALIDKRDDADTEAGWRALRAKARLRACEEGAERRGPGWRVWAARAVASEPEALVDIGADGRVPAATLLLDRAIGDHDPVDRSRLDWTSRRLFDGTPSASIRVEGSGRRLEITRDVLGQRPLVMARIAGGMVVASGEDIICAHPEISADLDLAWFAALIAGAAPDGVASPYRMIRTIPSGALMAFVDGRSATQMESLAIDRSVVESDDSEIVDRFRRHIDRSVFRAMRNSRRPGVLLGDGVYSLMVAESVARQWSGAERPVAVTFGFGGAGAIDERDWARRAAATWGFEHHGFAAGDFSIGPRDASPPVCIDTPWATPYRGIVDQAYSLAAQAGCDILLGGQLGDLLEVPGGPTTGAAIRFGNAARVRTPLTGSGLLGALRLRGLRSLTRPGQLFEPPMPAGLTRIGSTHREPIEKRLGERLEALSGWPRAVQVALGTDAISAHESHVENWFGARHGLAVRIPMRDTDLVRFAWSLPARSRRDSSIGDIAISALRGRVDTELLDGQRDSRGSHTAPDSWQHDRELRMTRAAQMRPVFMHLLSDSGRNEIDQPALVDLLAGISVWLEAVIAGGSAEDRVV